MAILIFALCVFLDFLILIGIFIVSKVQVFYQKRIPGLDYDSLVETAFLEGHIGIMKIIKGIGHG